MSYRAVGGMRDAVPTDPLLGIQLATGKHNTAFEPKSTSR